MMLRTEANLNHLPNRLQEVCAILARGLARLHSHTMEEPAPGTGRTQDQGDNSLHFPAHQSGHAKPKKRRLA